MSSSLAKMITPLALLVSISRLMILSNSPAVGSRGIFTDWAIHTPPERDRQVQVETDKFNEKQCFHLSSSQPAIHTPIMMTRAFIHIFFWLFSGKWVNICASLQQFHSWDSIIFWNSQSLWLETQNNLFNTVWHDRVFTVYRIRIFFLIIHL